MTTYDLELPQYTSGIAGLTLRIRRAIEASIGRISQPLDRAQLEQLVATRHEARQAIASRGDEHHGLYQLLR